MRRVANLTGSTCRAKSGGNAFSVLRVLSRYRFFSVAVRCRLPAPVRACVGGFGPFADGTAALVAACRGRQRRFCFEKGMRFSQTSAKRPRARLVSRPEFACRASSARPMLAECRSCRLTAYRPALALCEAFGASAQGQAQSNLARNGSFRQPNPGSGRALLFLPRSTLTGPSPSVGVVEAAPEPWLTAERRVKALRRG